MNSELIQKKIEKSFGSKVSLQNGVLFASAKLCLVRKNA